MAATAETKVERPLLRTIQGVVASDKGNKTIKVQVNYQTKHPKYGKYLKRRTILHAHDEQNEAKEGDQLNMELLEKQKHLFELRSQAVTEKLEDPSQLTKTRRDIARIQTVLRQRQLEASKTKN
jgi:small subunit ribosomal protein S17